MQCSPEALAAVRAGSLPSKFLGDIEEAAVTEASGTKRYLGSAEICEGRAVPGRASPCAAACQTQAKQPINAAIKCSLSTVAILCTCSPTDSCQL